MNPSPTDGEDPGHCPGVFFSLSKKPRRVCRRWRQIESNPFSAGACTWQKTLLSPIGGQIVRAAGCQSLSEKPGGVFRQSREDPGALPRGLLVFIDYVGLSHCGHIAGSGQIGGGRFHRFNGTEVFLGYQEVIESPLPEPVNGVGAVGADDYVQRACGRDNGHP